MRLTWTKPNGEWGLTGITEEELKNVGSRIYAALCKLRDYEDTGITPLQIRELDNEHTERCKELAKLQKQFNKLNKFEESQLAETIAELTTYRQREEYHIGDIVYHILAAGKRDNKPAYEVYQTKATQLEINMFGITVWGETIKPLEMGTKCIGGVPGKTVFKTEREAKQRKTELEKKN